jgi:hypothetical protein
MALRIPQITAQPALLCDWIELKALSNPVGQYRISLLKRLWDIGRNSEHANPAGRAEREEDTDAEGVGGDDDDVFIDSVVTEVESRIEALGGAYPFELVPGNKLRVVGPPRVGGYMYLFSLLLTHANGRELLDGTWRPAVDNRVRNLFQACSSVAAAGELRGSAVSFGWPRISASKPFLVRLREVYALFGEGEVVEQPKRGVTPYIKDGEIDVIAWKPQRDRAAGTHYLLAQVASGDGWEEKPLSSNAITTFHRNWFVTPPASDARRSIFIPHTVLPRRRGDSRRDRMNAIQATFGTIFDRMRLPLLVQEGVDHAQQRPDVTVEGHYALNSITEWVNLQLIALQGASG